MANHRLRRRSDTVPTSALPFPLAATSPQSGYDHVLLPDRRQADSPRFAHQLNVKLSSLTLAFDPLVLTVEATVINASRGGICLSTAWPLAISSSVRCELSLADDRFRIPTLMQVRWVNTSNDNIYICGLQYLV